MGTKLGLALLAAAVFGVAGCGSAVSSPPAVQSVTSTPTATPPPVGPAAGNPYAGGNVPREQWVALDQPIGGSSGCLISYGGRMTPQGSTEAKEIRVVYTPGPNPPEQGACPMGAVFKLDQNDYQLMITGAPLVDQEYAKEMTQLKAVDPAADFSQLTLTPLSAFRAPTVRVMNPDRRFWTQCVIDPSGQIRPIGLVSLSILVEYTASQPVVGSKCPSGTWFLDRSVQADGMPVLR